VRWQAMTLTWLVGAIEAFEARTRTRAAGRSLLALAQLSILVFSPATSLFPRVPGVTETVRCGGVRSATLWCLAGGREVTAAQVFAAAVLALVVIGWRPRWTCIPHWYVAFSLGNDITLPDGGLYVSQIVTLLLIPGCLADRRAWQWSPRTEPVPDRWRGRAFAAELVLRLQIAIVYAVSALAKLTGPSWRNGTALYTILRDPIYGVQHSLQQTVDTVFAHRSVLVAATWGVIATELIISALFLGPRSFRNYGLVLVVVLHSVIIAVMGLVSFGLTMIAYALILCGDVLASRPDATAHGKPEGACHAGGVGSAGSADRDGGRPPGLLRVVGGGVRGGPAGRRPAGL
jgi:antimicrobial peptide system SdpB family protein